jgi:hypothetical protein
MDRPTKKIILPITKKEVEIYTYITGGEKRQINEILTAGISADTSGQIKGDIPLSVVYKANDKALELLVLHVVANDLPSTDYDFLLNEVNQITKDEKFEEKKTI